MSTDRKTLKTFMLIILLLELRNYRTRLCSLRSLITQPCLSLVIQDLRAESLIPGPASVFGIWDVKPCSGEMHGQDTAGSSLSGPEDKAGKE